MTVAEIVDALSKFPPDMRVVINVDDEPQYVKSVEVPSAERRLWLGWSDEYVDVVLITDLPSA